MLSLGSLKEKRKSVLFFFLSLTTIHKEEGERSFMERGSFDVVGEGYGGLFGLLVP